MDYKTVIVGAGESGITQAQKLKDAGEENVLMIEFENQIGGRPWENLTNNIAPYETLLETKVIKIEKDTDNKFILTCQNNKGTFSIVTDKVYLTTGSVERERFFDLITGDRPAGDMVPKLALNLLKRGYAPGHKPVIFNSSEYAQELIEKLNNYSDIEVKEVDSSEYRITNVFGKARVESVEVLRLSDNERQIINCDALIYSNGYLPMTHSILDLGLDLDQDKRIKTDKLGQSSMPGFYAFGDVAKIK